MFLHNIQLENPFIVKTDRLEIAHCIYSADWDVAVVFV